MRRRLLFLIALALLLVPSAASAIQLHWSSGSSAISFTAATRCTLVVQADSAEASLPNQWRLLWAADSSGVQFVAVDSALACQADTAKVSSIDGPGTPEDSSANLITAHFCSDPSSGATLAYYQLDLAAQSQGKLKVIALSPVDTSQVIESNEVTFNGGVDGDYPPALLAASSSRQSTIFTVRAVGSGLSAMSSVTIADPAGRWRIGLEVGARSDTSLTASAIVSAAVPPCVVQAASQGGAASTSLAGDATQPQNPEFAPSLMREAFTQAEKDSMALNPPKGRIQPKDFAFLFAQNMFHVFYIRQNMWDSTYRASGRVDSTTREFGHVRSWTLLDDWKWAQPPATSPIDTIAFAARPGKWDGLHVWAPTMVHRDSFFMFYAGVGDTLAENIHQHHQRIGVATSTDLSAWRRYDPILSVANVPWAKKVFPPTYDDGSQQLRDPYVMPDPGTPGHWLMYFAAVDSSKYPAMAIGVARSRGSLFEWIADPAPLRCTDSVATHGAWHVESPHVFQHGDRWRLFFTPSAPHGNSDGLPYGPVSFVVSDSAGDPADTLASHWSNPVDTVYNYQFPHQDPTLEYWHASEYLQVGDHEYLAAYDDYSMGVVISELVWSGPQTFVLAAPSVTNVAVPRSHPTGTGELGLSLLGPRPARGEVSLEIDLPRALHATVVVYDVLGRHVKTLLTGNLPPGRTAVSWDGCDASGAVASSGIYFARLSCPAGSRVVKAVVLR